MTKIRTRNQRGKPAQGNRDGAGLEQAADSTSNSEEQHPVALTAAQVNDVMRLLSRCSPYRTLELQGKHDRSLDQRVRKAAALAKRLAKNLKGLSKLLGKIDQERRDGPFLRWLRLRDPVMYRAHIFYDPKAWQWKAKGGPSRMAGLLAEPFERYVAAPLGEEVVGLRARRGGAPKKIVFNFACSFLSRQNRTERQIAESLRGAGLAHGTLAQVQDRVRVFLNRHADSTEPDQPLERVHPLAEVIEMIQQMWEEKEREFVKEGEAAECVGCDPEPMK